MPPELRKRKAPASEPAAAPPAKKKSAVAKVVEKVKKAVVPKKEKTNGAAVSTSSSKVAVGSTITLEGFGGEVETNDGVKTTLKKLVEESKGGVVLFTYPKASTPGCKLLLCHRLGRHILMLQKVQHKSASSATLTLLSLQLVSPSTVSPKIPPKQTRPLKPSKTFRIRYSAIPARH
jgi:hypothetical protein